MKNQNIILVTVLLLICRVHSQDDSLQTTDSLFTPLEIVALAQNDSSPIVKTGAVTKIEPQSTHPLPFLAGDALQITVFPDSTSIPSGIYPIDGNGYIDLPVIGYLKVTGMSTTVLADTLRATFAEFLRYPFIKIRPLTRITFMGGFRRPGDYWIDPHSSLWQAVQMAGNTTRSDGLKKMKWERDKKFVSENLLPFFQSGQSLYQIGFRSGDQMFVTHRGERTGWEVFRVEVLPMLTFTMSTALTAASVYQTYRLFKNGTF
jgi:protein involved in polysaccharide export with SLBB domain